MFKSKEDFLSLLLKVKEIAPNQYMACCPAHEDKNPSLSIKFDDGKILLHCFAECSVDDILNSLGLTKSDLYYDIGVKSSSNKSITDYEYFNADGRLAYTKTRYDKFDGSKSFKCMQPNGIKSLKGVKKVLYNLPAVIKSDTVYLVEGEKCADAIIKQGYVATTLYTGANSKWEDTYSQYLENKNIIILPDNDLAGFKYAKMLKENLPFAKVILLDDLSNKEDIYDWLQKGHTMEEIGDLQEFDVISYFDESDNGIEDKEINQREPQSKSLLSLIQNNGCELFCDSSNEAYASVTINEHKEILPIDSKDFYWYLNHLYYKEFKRPINKDNLLQVINVMLSEARFGTDKKIKLSNRVTEYQNAFWYDLTNADWQAVKITENGWTIENNVPILFNRYRHQQAQILPNNNGDINRILKYINIKNNHTLFLCWLVSCFVPDIPHSVLVVYGEMGSAKSTACSLLKQLIDPSALDTLTIQKDMRSLVVNLQQHWFLPFDNVSYINEEVSDTLCRAITGVGIQQRKLNTNAEDCIFTFKRCFAINGINNIATRSDLLDRAVLMELSRISDKDRKELAEVQNDFKKDLPYILGGIFDILAKAITIYPNVKLNKLERMADFTRWGYAIGEALDNKGQIFLDEYKKNIDSQNIEAVNNDVVATLMIEFMRDKKEWTGRMSELLNALLNLTSNCGISANSKQIPKAANHLSRRLKVLKSNLNSMGISFDIYTNYSDGTHIFIKNKNLSPLPPYRQKFNNETACCGDDNELLSSDNGDNYEDNVTF
ncbi:MAG: hypothetical protein ACLUFN_04505 [Eubacterium sp.]